MTKQTTFIFDMGDKVEDVVSGFAGIVTSRTEYWTGCNHYGIEGEAKDGKDAYQNIDEQRLKLKKAAAKSLVREYVHQEAAPEAPAVTRTSPGRTVTVTPPHR